jgi:hypothetical protein
LGEPLHGCPPVDLDPMGDRQTDQCDLCTNGGFYTGKESDEGDGE